MIVGLTYDLRQDYLDLGYSEEETAEFDRIDTIDAIDGALQALGYQTDRIGNIWKLNHRLARGDRWDLVFNIAEGLHGIAREAQVPALLDAFSIPYTFSDPLVLGLTLHKGLAKRVFRDLGLPTPAFIEIHAPSDLAGFDLPFPVFAKPIAEGTGKGIASKSIIHDHGQLERVCRQLLTEFRQPALVETYLPGREFTVAIVGTGMDARSLGIMEIVLRSGAEHDAYTFENKEHWERFVEYVIPTDDAALQAVDTALRAWRGLGCRDAGRIDLRADAGGTPNLMEINPLAGIHPQHSDMPIICSMMGIGYLDLIGMIMQSALSRLRPAEAALEGAL
jgi:D-alanine-D-alanine ligase